MLVGDRQQVALGADNGDTVAADLLDCQFIVADIQFIAHLELAPVDDFVAEPVVSRAVLFDQY